MRRSLMVGLLAAVAAVLCLSLNVGPAASSMPQTACDANTVGGTIVTPDGERWQCQFNEYFEDYFWTPLPPLVLPTDAVGYKTNTMTTSDGVIHYVSPRVEWINNILYTGFDTYLRKPLTRRWTVVSTWIGVYSYLWAWNGTGWDSCKESGWVHSTTAGWSFTPTFNWGRAPCGTKWYAASGYAEHWSGTAWAVDPQSTITVGGTSLGSSKYATRGMVWDPRPGDHRRPGKRPRKMPPRNVTPPSDSRRAMPVPAMAPRLPVTAIAPGQ